MDWSAGLWTIREPKLHTNNELSPFVEMAGGSGSSCEPCIPNAVNIFQVIDFSCCSGYFRHVLFTVVSPNSLRFRCGVSRRTLSAANKRFSNGLRLARRAGRRPFLPIPAEPTIQSDAQLKMDSK